MEKQAIRNLVDTHKKGSAMDRAFYTDADIYERELSEIYLKSWIYAGHVSEVPNIGDWFRPSRSWIPRQHAGRTRYSGLMLDFWRPSATDFTLAAFSIRWYVDVS